MDGKKLIFRGKYFDRLKNGGNIILNIVRLNEKIWQTLGYRVVKTDNCEIDQISFPSKLLP